MPKLPGLVEWFAFEDRERVERAVKALTELKVTEFRTLFSWADFEREGGPAWFDWFVGELMRVPNLRLLPSLFYTPPHFARKDAGGKQKTSYPPLNLALYTDFVREVLNRYGAHFDWIQLWNEPNWDPYWSWDMDPSGELFAQMVMPAADLVRARDKKAVLGGTSPLDYPWFAQMSELGVLTHFDAVSFHYAQGWENMHRRWFPLATEIAALRALLKGFGHEPELWLDESGLSTSTRTDQDEAKREAMQVRFFDELCSLPAERAYWFCLFDQREDTPTDNELNSGEDRDPTAYHFGMIRADGSAKPLYEHWERRAGTENAGSSS